MGFKDLFEEYNNWPDKKPEVHDIKPLGWFHKKTKEMLESTIPEFGKFDIIELGSWGGLSTRYMLKRNQECRVVAIDTWMGEKVDFYQALCPIRRAKSLEEVLNIVDESCPLFGNSIYETFLHYSWEFRDRLIPLRTTTSSGLFICKRHNYNPKLIYIDASHDLGSVFCDIYLSRKLFPDSILIGDDFDYFGVKSGVDLALGTGIVENGKAWKFLPITIDFV